MGKGSLSLTVKCRHDVLVRHQCLLCAVTVNDTKHLRSILIFQVMIQGLLGLYVLVKGVELVALDLLEII